MASEVQYPQVKIEYHIMTPLGRCAHIFTNCKRAEEYWKTLNRPDWRVVRVTTTLHDATPLNKAEIEHHIDHIWSLEDYISWLNRDDDMVTVLHSDIVSWNDIGIRTARDLAKYLDDCVERELGDPARLEV